MILLAACSKDDSEAAPKISIQPDTVVPILTIPTIADAQAGPPSPEGNLSTGPVITPPRLLIPVAGVSWSQLRDSYNDKRGTRTHNALDIMAARGTAVLSADDGTLLKMHNSVAGGLTAYAADPGRRFIYLYGHLDSYHQSLSEGAAIKRGDTIGFVGSTGNAAAAGPHLHFAVARTDDMKRWWAGTPIDPRPLMR